MWIPYLEVMGVLVAIFPDGRWRSRRWRNAIVVCCAGVLTAAAGNALLPAFVVFPQFENPVGLRGVDADTYLQVVNAVTWFFGLGLILTGAANAVARFRHARGDERQQMKWLALAAALIAVATTTLGVVTGFTGIAPPGRKWIESLTVASLFSIPIAIAVGMDVVDRSFYRRKYDAEQTIARFGARLLHGADLDALHSDLIRVVDEAMRPAHTAIWLRPHADATSMGTRPR